MAECTAAGRSTSGHAAGLRLAVVMLGDADTNIHTTATIAILRRVN